jgi:hypothetical protein
MELASLEIKAIDFVEDNRKEELERVLMEITGKSDIPGWFFSDRLPRSFF